MSNVVGFIAVAHHRLTIKQENTTQRIELESAAVRPRPMTKHSKAFLVGLLAVGADVSVDGPSVSPLVLEELALAAKTTDAGTLHIYRAGHLEVELVHELVAVAGGGGKHLHFHFED